MKLKNKTTQGGYMTRNNGKTLHDPLGITRQGLKEQTTDRITLVYHSLGCGHNNYNIYYINAHQISRFPSARIMVSE